MSVDDVIILPCKVKFWKTSQPELTLYDLELFKI